MASNLSTQLLLKNIPLVESFTGDNDQDPLTWLQDMNAWFDAAGTDQKDHRRLLPMCFGEDVKKWYRSSETEEDYDAFQEQFRKAFTSPAYKLQISNKLINRKQGSNESVQSYYYDVVSLCNKFNKAMDNNEILVYLLRALKPSVQQQVIINNPTDHRHLLEIAIRIEATAKVLSPQDTAETDIDTHETTAALHRMSITHNNARRGHTTTSSHRSWPHTFNRPTQMWETPSARRTRPTLPSRPVVCYNCGGQGHYSYQCPSHLN